MGLSVAIPDTSIEDCPDLRQKTVKLGHLARVFAVFKVEKVFIYVTQPHNPQVKRDRDLTMKILKYMDTPQYLRKRIFPRSSSLRYVGVLPPLRTRSHPLQIQAEKLEMGDIRWGVLDRGEQVDIGLSRLAQCHSRLQERIPYLFRVTDVHPNLQVDVIERDEVGIYWGFEVEEIPSLPEYLANRHGCTRVIFSRNGAPFNRIESTLKATISGTHDLLALFGGPSEGVAEIFRPEIEHLKANVEFWINSIPGQGTETVRLEEAINVSLGLLNISIGNLVTRPGFYET